MNKKVTLIAFDKTRDRYITTEVELNMEVMESVLDFMDTVPYEDYYLEAGTFENLTEEEQEILYGAGVTWIEFVEK